MRLASPRTLIVTVITTAFLLGPIASTQAAAPAALGTSGPLGSATRLIRGFVTNEALDALIADAPASSPLVRGLEISIWSQQLDYDVPTNRMKLLAPSVQPDTSTESIAATVQSLTTQLRAAAKQNGDERTATLARFQAQYERNQPVLRSAPDLIDTAAKSGTLLPDWSRFIATSQRYWTFRTQLDAGLPIDKLQALIAQTLLVNDAYAAIRQAAGEPVEALPRAHRELANPDAATYAAWRTRASTDEMLHLGSNFAYDTQTRRVYWFSREDVTRAEGVRLAATVTADVPRGWPSWKATGTDLAPVVPATVGELNELLAKAGPYPAWNPKVHRTPGDALEDAGMPSHVASYSTKGFWTRQVDKYTTSTLGAFKWTGYLAWDPARAGLVATKCEAAAGASCPVIRQVPRQGCSNNPMLQLIGRRMNEATIMGRFGWRDYMNPCYYTKTMFDRKPFPTRGSFDRAQVMLRTPPLPVNQWRFTVR